MYLYMGLAFFVVGVLFFLIPIRVSLEYRLVQGEDTLLVEATWLGLRLTRRRIPVLSGEGVEKTGLKMGGEGAGTAADDDNQAIISAVTRCLHLLFDTAGGIRLGKDRRGSLHNPLYRWVLSLFSRDAAMLGRQIEELRWSTTIGLGDAAATALLAGTVSALKAVGLAWLERKVKINPARLRWQVIPYFGELRVEVHIYCILGVNAGHIIITGIVNAVRSQFQKAALWKKRLAAIEE